MRPIKTTDDLRGIAAAKGATVELGGRTINADGTRVGLVPRQPPERQQDLPKPAIQPGMTEAEVRRLVEQRDEMWQLRLDALQNQIDILVGLTGAAARRVPWQMSATYLADGRIDKLVASPMEGA